MRRFLMGLILLGSLSMAFADEAAAGRVIKALPLFLDLKGHDAVSPSLLRPRRLPGLSPPAS